MTPHVVCIVDAYIANGRICLRCGMSDGSIFGAHWLCTDFAEFGAQVAPPDADFRMPGVDSFCAPGSDTAQ